MKSPSHHHSPSRALCVATVALLFTAAGALAQTGQPGATSAGSSQKNPPADTSGQASSSASSSKDTSTSPSTATSTNSSTQNADVQSTTEINSQTRTGAGAMTGRETTSKTDKLSWGDKHFINKTADDGRDEVALAQLAAERASNPEVKSFAQKMVDDHTKVNDELKQIASQKNVKIDDDNDHDRTYKRLAKKTGMDFDREFVEHMVDDHEKAIKMFEKASSDAKDADVRSFASKHLDHLREHLQAAQSLRQSVIPTGRMDSTSGRSDSGAATSSGTSTSGTSSSSDKSSTGSGSNYGTSSGSSSSDQNKSTTTKP